MIDLIWLYQSFWSKYRFGNITRVNRWEIGLLADRALDFELLLIWIMRIFLRRIKTYKTFNKEMEQSFLISKNGRWNSIIDELPGMLDSQRLLVLLDMKLLEEFHLTLNIYLGKGTGLVKRVDEIINPGMMIKLLAKK